MDLAVARYGAAARIDRKAGGWIRQRPHGAASAPASGSSQRSHRTPAGNGRSRQQESQTPPRKSSRTSPASQARQREGSSESVAARPIRLSAVARLIEL